MTIPQQLDAFTNEPAPLQQRPLSAPYQRSSVPSRESAKLAAGRLNEHHRAIMRLAYASDSKTPRGFTRKDVERICNLKTPTACARLFALEESRKLRKLHTIASEPGLKLRNVVVTRERCSVYVLGPMARPKDCK
jgi:hypothetical protein